MEEYHPSINTILIHNFFAYPIAVVITISLSWPMISTNNKKIISSSYTIIIKIINGAVKIPNRITSPYKTSVLNFSG